MSYMDELKQQLQKRQIRKETIDDILADHEDMIRVAMSEGLSEADLHTKFGDPAKLAAELAESSQPEEADEVVSGVTWKKLTWNTPDLQIDVKMVNEDIRFRFQQEQEIRIDLLEGKANMEDYVLKMEGNTLVFHAPKHVRTPFFMIQTKNPVFQVFLPRSATISNLKVAMVNGDATMSKIEASILEASSTNGEILIEGGTYGKLKYHTVNGDVCVTDAKLDSIVGSAVSGDASIRNCSIKGDLILNTVSGDAKVVDCVSDYAELATVSGDLEGTEFYPKRLALKSVSGDIAIANRRKDEIEIVRRSSVSGSISIGGR